MSDYHTKKPDALRRTGSRLPPVRSEIARLLQAILDSRGDTKAEHIANALILYATEEELKEAGIDSVSVGIT